MKKVILSVITILVLNILAFTTVYAKATTIDINLSSNIQELQGGQDIIVTLKLDKYTNITKGVNAYKATLVYDKTIFKEVVLEDFVCQNNWEQLKYNKTTGEFVAIKKKGSKSPEEVVKISLKVRENASYGKTSIKIKDVVTSEGKKDLFIGDKSIDLHVVGEQSNINNNPSNTLPSAIPEPKRVEKNSSKTTKPVNRESGRKTLEKDSSANSNSQNEADDDDEDDEEESNEFSEETTSKKEKVKQTTKSYFWAFVLIGAEVLALFIFILAKRKKDDDDDDNNSNAKKAMMYIIIGIVAIHFLGTSYALMYDFNKKGELNGDSIINYADVDLLELHLINSKELPEEKQENADINSDGQVTVTDLTLLIQKLENTLDYDISISNIELDNYHPNKNEEITLSFNGEVSYGAEIEKVIINDKEYSVTKTIGKEDEYSVKIKVPGNAGIKEYKINEALLNNDKKVKLNHNFKVDVLKDVPVFDNYTVEEDINDSKLYLSYTLTDKDNSVNSAKLTILNEKNEIVQEENIKKGENRIGVSVIEGKIYNAKIDITYDLSSDNLSQEDTYSYSIYYEKQLQLAINYNFSLVNIKTYIDGREVSSLDKNHPFQLVFESINNTIHEPSTIKLNGNVYKVEKQGNVFVANIDGIKEVGRKELNIEEVVLSNGKKFVLADNNTILVNVVKNNPTVTEMLLTEDTDNNKLKVQFNLNDEDHAIENAVVVLYDNSGKEISRTGLTKEEIKTGGKISKDLDTEITSKYTVKVIIDYNKTGLDADNIVGSILHTQEIVAAPRADIIDVAVDKNYIEKSGQVTLTYQIESNKTENISKIRVNDTDCVATKLANNNYQITFAVGNVSGIYNLETTKLFYSDNTEATVNKVVKVDILKDKPVVKNFAQSDDIDNSEVTLSFDIDDVDNSFISGKAVLTNGLVSIEKNIKKGNNNITFKVENAKEYTLKLKVTYDRDTNSFEDDNKNNFVEDDVISISTIQLLTDYELSVSDIKTYNGVGETRYFSKNESITVDFASSNLSIFEPVSAVIDGKKYILTKVNNKYQTQIDGYDKAGVKNISINKITLNNTKELNLENNNKVKIEVLKDKPEITNLQYQENNDGMLAITFKLKDTEGAFKSGSIAIINKKEVVKEQSLITGNNTLSFMPQSDEEYSIKIVANYDLDTNELTTGSNEYQNIVLHEEDLNIGSRQFEVKDITDIAVYKQTAEGVKEALSLNETDLTNLDNYIVKVVSKKMPTFYTTIDSYIIENNKLKFILNYENVVQYINGEKQNKLEVVYGDIKNGVAENVSLEKLIEHIMANPNGTFELSRDYDASTLSSNYNTLITTAFTGTLNGNGHTIYNLSKPLFDTLDGATIKGVVLENVTLSGANSRGSIANTATNTTITNVHINGLNFVTGANHTGGIIGDATTTNVEKSSVTNFNIKTSGHIRISAIIGRLTGGSIKNCYVEGTLNSTQTKDGNGIGGVLGHGFGIVNIENCIVKVAYTNNVSHRLNGAIVGIFANKSSTLKNNVSLSTGTNFYSIHGNEPASTATNNYELADSGLTSNSSGNRVIQISQKDINKSFYKESASFSEEIWNLSDVSFNKLPTLKNDDPNNKEAQQSSNVKLYIPDYARIRKINGYSDDKEILYHNLNKLMPYYDAKYLVIDGLKIANDNVLNTKIIKSIFAYDANGKQVVALGQNEQNRIRKIRILFEDDDSITYDVTYKGENNLISLYTIDELGTDYSFDRYLVNKNSKVYNYIVDQIKNSDYVNGISTITEEVETRNYIDNYVKVKNKAGEFALNLMANVEEFNFTSSSLVLENKILQELKNDRTLDKLLYAYNYYDRFYNFEIGGLNIRDIIFFDGRLFSDKFNPINMTNNLLNTTEANRLTTGANNFFGSYILPLTGKNIYYFVDYFIENLTTDKYKKDTASWIIDNYQGSIYEALAPRYPELRSRVWDHLKARPHLILYILSYPGDDLYVMGAPTTLFVGNLRLYFSNYETVTAEQKLNLLKNYADNYVVPLYDTVAGVVEGTRGFTNISNFSQISYDTTQVKNWSNDPNAAPVYKYFYEARNHWITAPASAAAFANGTDMHWVHYRALSDFLVFTHESIHNQDGRIFLEGTGRRRGAGAEHFTDNFLTQPYPNATGNAITGAGIYGVVPNYTYTRAITSIMTTNLTKERINNKEKIESYYKGMYDTFAFLDYIEAQAFLQLTPEEQCQIAQAVEDGAYTWKNADDFRKMNLKTMEDIWDNHLVIIRGNKAYTTGSLWYIYENPNVGASAKAFFVLNAYQFLADFGYAGYTGYAGNTNGSLTDAEVLKKISGDPNITWKSYQLGRYQKVAEKIKTYAPIDVDTAINKTLEAMKIDVKNNVPIDLNSNASIYRETLYGYLKRVTNDFERSIYEKDTNTVHISSAEQFIEKIKDHPEVNVVLDKDLDFSNISVDDSSQYILSTFVGKLDGNNHKITGLTRPLFSIMVFAKVQNLTIENANIVSSNSTTGALSKNMTFCLIDNVTLKNVNVVGTNVVGGLAGNAAKTTVSNVKYENVNISSSNNSNTIGGLFGAANYSSITNVHGINSTMTGNGNIGGLIGNANYLFEVNGVSFNGKIDNKGNQSGGLIGYLQNSTIKNSYTLGSVSGNANVGGIAGYVANSNITNTYNNATVKGNALASTGGLFGNVVSGKFTNNISFGRVNNGYKVYGNSTQAIVEAGFSNNYELVESVGHSTLEKPGIDFTKRITSVNIANLNNNFYTNTLKFDSNIWNLANVSSGGLPKLKNNDPNNVGEIIEKKEIRTISDFLKLNDNPSDDYILKNDLDFTGYEVENNARGVITTAFTGRIDGNGHTISNLTNASLFTNFRGTVQNLKIKDFSNISSGDNVTAFANYTSNAILKNMKFDNITLNGRHRVAVVVGQDDANSVFENISVKNAKVKGTGVYISTFIGRKYGGSIKDVFVQGSIEITTTENGGVVGALQRGGTIENVVSNVTINKTKNTYSPVANSEFNGGIVGNIYDSPIIKNSISLGAMQGFINNSGTELLPYKFTGAITTMIVATMENCYEVVGVKGSSSITSDTVGKLNAITSQQLHNTAFYKNTLHFDEKSWNFDKISVNGYPELK